MPFQYHWLVYVWMMTLFALSLVSAWALPSVALMFAITVMNKLEFLAGMHGLSCRWSEGRHYRHAAINEIICRSLTSVNVPSLLEPSGLFRSDGKRPDRVTVTPWSSGKPLVWDATCPDTFAWSHRSLAVLVAGKVAAKAEEHKERKYSDLMSSHFWSFWHGH